MLARCRSLNDRWGLALSLVLALALFVRLAAPVFGAADRAGYVAICSGSEIVYVPVTATGEPIADPDTAKPGKGDPQATPPLHSPCSWLGQYAALLPDVLGLALPLDRIRTPEPQGHATAPPLRSAKPFHSQGPPPPSA
ncbi:hypothetical protein [Azospirillum griseum]|uniref:DUF2946 domain-containing protein n=1 Tax=Azospirillum griseum TaxID=2496639 RepID=A0A431VPB6_9PROT|nr:hypothetical protein [Azospirillum griseum]RTR24567.1 hypothetical protein EJ903_02070 [Azospirillum griseum]